MFASQSMFLRSFASSAVLQYNFMLPFCNLFAAWSFGVFSSKFISSIAYCSFSMISLEVMLSNCFFVSLSASSIVRVISRFVCSAFISCMFSCNADQFDGFEAALADIICTFSAAVSAYILGFVIDSLNSCISAFHSRSMWSSLSMMSSSRVLFMRLLYIVSIRSSCLTRPCIMLCISTCSGWAAVATFRLAILSVAFSTNTMHYRKSSSFPELCCRQSSWHSYSSMYSGISQMTVPVLRCVSLGGVFMSVLLGVGIGTLDGLVFCFLFGAAIGFAFGGAEVVGRWVGVGVSGRSWEYDREAGSSCLCFSSLSAFFFTTGACGLFSAACLVGRLGVLFTTHDGWKPSFSSSLSCVRSLHDLLPSSSILRRCILALYLRLLTSPSITPRWHFGRFHQKAAHCRQLPEPIGISPSHTHKSCALLPCGPHPLSIFQPILVIGLYNVLLIMKAKRDSAKGPEPFFGMGSRPNVKSHFNNRDSTNTKPHFILTFKTQTRQRR